MSMNRFSGLDLLELPNCMGLAGTGCFWLNISACEGENCTFKRSETEYNSLHTKVFQRLSNLSNSKQTYIANKYYEGKKPWNE